MTLIEIIAGALKVKPDTLNEDSSPSNNERWDSVSHMFLAAELERRFGFELPQREWDQKAGSVRAIRALLKEAGIDIE